MSMFILHNRVYGSDKLKDTNLEDIWQCWEIAQKVNVQDVYNFHGWYSLADGET